MANDDRILLFFYIISCYNLRLLKTLFNVMKRIFFTDWCSLKIK